VSAVFQHLDEVLVRVTRLRDQLLADPYAVDRSAGLAAVFESEARVWSQLYELSSVRLLWRAALAAEAGARVNAQVWARRAAAGAELVALPRYGVVNGIGAANSAVLAPTGRGV
jgi:hypothetical protein